MSLSSELDAMKAALSAKAPADVLSAVRTANRQLAASGIAEKALKAGAQAPGFELPDAAGRPVRLDDLLERGAVVLSFYRGSWCPFCNLTLAALQRELPRIVQAGATLVAVSPQTPEATAATVQHLGTAFPVLSDAGNAVARAYGLVFTVAEEVRPMYRALGSDLPKANGDDSHELPISATYIIGRDRRILYAFVDSDHTRRMEPAEIVRVLRSGTHP